MVRVNATNIVAVWDSVTNPPDDIYKYERRVRVDPTMEVHGTEIFRPSDHPYVEFDNLWPGRQYEVCCKAFRINIENPADQCVPQVTGIY